MKCSSVNDPSHLPRPLREGWLSARKLHDLRWLLLLIGCWLGDLPATLASPRPDDPRLDPHAEKDSESRRGAPRQLGLDPVGEGDWPQWRGPHSRACQTGTGYPSHWNLENGDHVIWSTELPGEGASSPIVVGDRLFITFALDGGEQRGLRCLDKHTGREAWTRVIRHDNPEPTSAIAGHAAATPVSDGRRVVAFFGNAGLVCWDMQGRLQWQVDLGQFESELGLASSPIIHNGLVFQLCDHDGVHYRSFDSYLVALELDSGKQRWKSNRRKLLRSWSTPVIVPVPATAGDQPNQARTELVVSAQDEARAYDPRSGEQVWRVGGLTGWVSPTPAWDRQHVYLTSGKDGPTLAVRPGGKGDVTQSHVAWQDPRGAPYVCSPLLVGNRLYVHTEQGRLSVYRADAGELIYRQRVSDRFTASAVSADGLIYLPAESGTVYVFRDADRFQLVAKNKLGEEMVASPALSEGKVYVRTLTRLYCLGTAP